MSKIDVNEWTEKKNGLTYLSWAHAWKLFKQHAPDATYKIAKSESGSVAFRCGTGLSVYTSVTAEGESHEMWLPVLDFKNQSVDADQANSFQINKTVMRCLVKNLAMFGLGIYIYAGEDLPESSDTTTTPNPAHKQTAAKHEPKEEAKPVYVDHNVGCEKWEDWKTSKGTKLSDVAGSNDESPDEKEAKLVQLGKWIKAHHENNPSLAEAEIIERDLKFVRAAIESLEVPF